MQGSPSPQRTSAAHPGGGFRPHAGRCPEVQGVLDRPTRSRRATSASAASARSRSPTRRPTPTRRRSSAASRRARTRSGATPTSCRWRAPPRSALPTGWTPLVKADRLAERLGLARAVDQERDGQPDALVQGPRRLRRARPRAGARLRDARLRLDRQPRQRGRRPRRRRRAARLRASSRADLEEQKILATGAYGTQRRRRPAATTTTVNRLCTELVGRARRLGVRERQHAPVLRRGLQDARLRDRRAARLGAARTASSAPIASGSLFTKIARGFEEWIDAGLLEGERADA